MDKVPVPKKARTPYWLRFSLVMLGFGGFTSAFVMVVLPKRFILQSGLVESGITFPTAALPFGSSGRHLVVQPIFPATLPDGASGVGPAEQFWSDALPFLERDDPAGALPIFADYLGRFPDDMNVWREYAVTLLRSDRVSEAEAAYERIVESGVAGARLDLARLRRDQGRFERAIPLYRELVAENTADLDLLHEFARTLIWAEQYVEATGLYRELTTRDPGSLVYRFELAQLLYWQGQVEEAFSILLAYPSSDSGWVEVEQLLFQMVPLVAPEVPSLPELIQRALAQGDRDEAMRLFERMLARTPRDSELWMEWVDFLQYDMLNLEAARGALQHRAALVGLSANARFRLAQLHVWTGHEDEAMADLQALIRSNSNNSDAWALLGDLYRWDGNRLAARDAYQRALRLNPGHEEARAGMLGIREQVDLIVAGNDPTGIVPEMMFFRDSDEFSRLDVSIRAATRLHTTSLVLNTGYRHLDGPGLGGISGTERGPFVQFEVVQWWRLGTVRTSVAAGFERFDTFGVEPAISAHVQVPDANGYAVQASFEHGPAYAHTVTVASMVGGVRSDNFNMSVYRGLGERFSVSATAGAVSLRGGGSEGIRGVAAATVTGRLSTTASLGISSRLLGHTDAAPVMGNRRLYWDPTAFWSNSLQFELRTPPGHEWELFARVSPGFALARERELVGTSVVPQFGSEAGASYETGSTTLQSDVAYYRGRAGDYSSFVVNLRLLVRP